MGVNFIIQKLCQCKKNDNYKVWSNSQAFTSQEPKTDKKRKKTWKCNVLAFEIQINPIDFAYEVCSHGKIGIPTHKVNDCFFQLIWKFWIEFTINLFVSLRSVLLITQGVDSDLINSQQSKGEKGQGVSSGKDFIH